MCWAMFLLQVVCWCSYTFVILSYCCGRFWFFWGSVKRIAFVEVCLVVNVLNNFRCKYFSTLIWSSIDLADVGNPIKTLMDHWSEYLLLSGTEQLLKESRRKKENIWYPSSEEWSVRWTYWWILSIRFRTKIPPLFRASHPSQLPY